MTHADKLAIGVISGTSADGIDVAALQGTGIAVTQTHGGLTLPYAGDLRAELLALMRTPERVRGADLSDLEARVTTAHVAAVEGFMESAGIDRDRVTVVGFHGQTILHQPADGYSRQLFDGALAARLLQIPVVADFRAADLAAGGEGAPLAPVYHQALSSPLTPPQVILNLGGIGNLTFVGARGALIAFDTGPANALLDDWVVNAGAGRFDQGGALAEAGRVNQDVLQQLLANSFFDRLPPKSLDRYDIAPAALYNHLSLADGAATLTAFSAAAVARGLALLPAAPQAIWVCGGGRLNPALMAAIAQATGVSTQPVEALGWNGDLLEAELCAFLALRHLENLPLSYPTTTGVVAPCLGGVYFAVAPDL